MVSGRRLARRSEIVSRPPEKTLSTATAEPKTTTLVDKNTDMKWSTQPGMCHGHGFMNLSFSFLRHLYSFIKHTIGVSHVTGHMRDHVIACDELYIEGLD